MAISNFYLPTGLTVSGTTLLTGSLHVTDNITADSLTGSISASYARIGFVNTNVVSASNLYLTDPFLLVADYIQAGGIEVGTSIQLSGILNVSGTTHLDKLTVTSTGSYNIVQPAITPPDHLNVAYAIQLLDSASISREEIYNAYDNIRIKITGSFVDGFAQINLTHLNSRFDTGSFDYISINVSIREFGSDRWTYPIISKELFISGSSTFIELTAQADKYKLIAVNEKDGIFGLSI